MDERDPLAPRPDAGDRNPNLEPKSMAAAEVDPITQAVSAFKSAQQGYHRASGEVAASESAVAAASAEMESAEAAHKGTIQHREIAAEQLRNAVDDMIGVLQSFRSSIT